MYFCTVLKKIFSILLFCILLFNTIGYQIIFYIAEQQATNALENKIDNGAYKESELVEISIPLNMPYYSDTDYETAYGETEINHQKYRFVKRKISDNKLFILCIPHQAKDKLLNAKKTFDTGNGIPDAEKNANQIIKLLQTEYVDNNATYKIDKLFTIIDTLKYSSIANNKYITKFHRNIEHPPEIA
jgi:hypothetical protein